MRNAAIVAVCVAGILSASVALREHSWRQAHPFQLGPSGYIVVLGIVGVCLAAVLGWVIHELAELSRQVDRRALADWVKES